MSKIKSVKAREILDSRGCPTIEVEIRTERLSFWPCCRRQGAGNTGISQKK